MSNTNVTAILLSAGISNRMNSDTRKQLIKIDGMSVVRRTALAFSAANTITSVIVVARKEDISAIWAEVSDIPKVSAVIEGGDCRAVSAKLGFNEAKGSCDFIAIHDGARCLVTPDMIDKVVRTAISEGAASAGTSVTDTVKRIDKEKCILDTVRRDELYFTTTPQVFSVKTYEQALNKYEGDLYLITDDNMLVEALGVKIKLVDCGKENIKITTAEDIDYAEFLLEKRKRDA